MRNETPEYKPPASDRDSTYDEMSESDIESVASHDSDYTNPSSSCSSGESSEGDEDDDDDGSESSEDDGGDGGSNRKQMQARTEAVAAAATARAQGYWREDESEHEAKVGDVDHTQVKFVRSIRSVCWLFACTPWLPLRNYSIVLYKMHCVVHVISAAATSPSARGLLHLVSLVCNL